MSRRFVADEWADTSKALNSLDDILKMLSKIEESAKTPEEKEVAEEASRRVQGGEGLQVVLNEMHDRGVDTNFADDIIKGESSNPSSGSVEVGEEISGTNSEGEEVSGKLVKYVFGRPQVDTGSGLEVIDPH